MADPFEDLGETLPIGGTNPSDAKDVDGSCAPATLVFLEGPNAGQVFPLDGERFVVGRREGSDLRIASQSVSKEHCVIVAGNSANFSIEDLGSTNGVLVNGARLGANAARPLFHGDNIRIADSLAMFRQTGCFQDETGSNRIQIDRDAVRREVDALLDDFGIRG